MFIIKASAGCRPVVMEEVEPRVFAVVSEERWHELVGEKTVYLGDCDTTLRSVLENDKPVLPATVIESPFRCVHTAQVELDATDFLGDEFCDVTIRVDGDDFEEASERAVEFIHAAHTALQLMDDPRFHSA